MFKVRCRLISFMADEEKFPCHFNYKPVHHKGCRAQRGQDLSGAVCFDDAGYSWRLSPGA